MILGQVYRITRGGLPPQSDRFSHRVEPTLGTGCFLGLRRRREVLHDLGVPFVGLRFLAGELLGNRQLEHCLGGVGALGIVGHVFLEVLEPFGLHLDEVGPGGLNFHTIVGRQVAKLHVRGQLSARFILLELLEQRFQPLGALRIRARLDRGADHVGQLPQPRCSILKAGPFRDLLDQVCAASVEPGLVRRRGRPAGLGIDLLQFSQQVLGLLVRPARRRCAPHCHGGLVEEPRIGRFGRAVGHRLRNVDDAPRVAHLHESANLHLIVLLGSPNDRHNVLIDLEVLG